MTRDDKHTPGPWKVTGVLSKHCASVDIHSESNLWVADAKGCHDIIESCGCRRKVSGFPTDEEAYANARLIAAAPYLLEALGEVLDCLESDERDFDTFVRIGEISVQAINRAEAKKK